MRLITWFVMLFSLAAGIFGHAAEVPGAASLADAQVAPASPQALADLEWQRIQQLPHGAWILVSTNFRAPIRCRFGGATDAYLFCSATLSPDESGWQFERASVTSVEASPRAAAPRNWHPGWISGIMAGGIIVGFVATNGTDAEHATRAGLIGALCTAAVTAPMAFLPRDPEPWAFGGRGVTALGVRVPLRQPRFRIRRH